MNNRRINPLVREHYARVERCYNCDGKEHTCEDYAFNPRKNKCGNRCVIENDLVKISQGSEFLTYPYLKRIIERDGK